MADFSQLPEDILDKIVTHHLDTSFAQRIAFAGVCKSWRSVALLPHNLRRRGLPGILMSPKLLPGDDDFTGSGSVPCIRSPHYYFPDLERLPTYHQGKSAGWPTTSFQEIKRHRCLASRDGWLLLGQPRIHLLNPVTGEKVDLPGLGNIIIHSAFISSSPHDDDGDCYVFVFSKYSSSQLAWCKLAAAAGGRGSGGWKFAGSEESRVFEDVAEAGSFYNGKLYVVAGDVVYILDDITTGEEPRAREVIPFSSAMKSPYDDVLRVSPYTCHINGQLYMILLRRVLHAPSEGISFHVYKLLKEDNGRYRKDHDRGEHRWERVRSLDGHAVYLGTRQCFSVPVVAVDDNAVVVGSILKNRIYFALNGCLGLADDDSIDDCWVWCSNDCGVFNVEDGVNECINYTDSSYNNIWFFPMPWNISKHKEHRAKSVVRSEGKSENGRDTWRLRQRSSL